MPGKPTIKLFETFGHWERPYEDMPRLELYDRVTTRLNEMHGLTSAIKLMPPMPGIARDTALIDLTIASNDVNRMYHELIVRFTIEGLDPRDNSGR